MRFVAMLLALASCKAVLHPGTSHVDGGDRPDSSDAGDVDATRPIDASRDGAPALTASELVARYDMNFCVAAFACESSFPGTTNQFAQYFGSSQSDCVARAAARDVPAVIDGDVAAGSIHFDPVAGAACVAGLGYQCGTFWNDGPTGDATCQAAITGTVANGGVCKVDWECTSWTSYCDDGTKTCTPSA